MKENKSRKRLSIDLDSHPDVRDMLQDAIEATGESSATLVIGAIRKELPKLIEQMQHERSKKTELFLGKYGRISSTQKMRPEWAQNLPHQKGVIVHNPKPLANK